MEINFPIILPSFDPVIFSIWGFQIRWYSLAYIFGILFGWLILKNFNKKGSPFINEKAMEDWIFWAVLGIIIGGRIGYILFYNFDFYLHHPTQILAVWNGGMSFHGGLIGSIISMFLFCRKYEIEFLKMTDLLTIAAPVGIFLGRIANFINMELYGRVTGSNYGVIFPNAGDMPRHPSQLYEATLEGLVLFLILFPLAQFTNIRNKPGILSGLFLCFYGIFRIFIEQFREPDSQIGLLFSNVTMGQILSLPFLIFGLIIIIYAIFAPKKLIRNN